MNSYLFTLGSLIGGEYLVLMAARYVVAPQDRLPGGGTSKQQNAAKFPALVGVLGGIFIYFVGINVGISGPAVSRPFSGFIALFLAAVLFHVVWLVILHKTKMKTIFTMTREVTVTSVYQTTVPLALTIMPVLFLFFANFNPFILVVMCVAFVLYAYLGGIIAKRYVC